MAYQDAGLVQLPSISNQPNLPAPGPYTVNMGGAVQDYLNQMNPQLMQQLIGMNAQYGPQFTDQTLQNVGSNVNFIGGFDGAMANSARGMAGVNEELMNRQNIFNQNQLYQNGAGAVQGYLQANPWMQSAMSHTDAMGGQQQNQGYNMMLGALQGGMGAPQNITGQNVSAQQIQSGGQMTPMQVQAERIAAERAQAERIAAGQVGTSNAMGGNLGDSLYQQALQAQQQSPLSAALNQQGMKLAQNPGQLSAEEIRAATQGSREGFAGAGRLFDNSSIAGEALSRAGAARDRYYQDIGAAQGINSQLLGAQQMGQQLATDVLKTDLGRQQFNIGNLLGADQFNVSAAMQAAMANQGTGLQASLSNQDAALRAAMSNQSFNFQGQLANQQAGMDAQRFNILNSQNVQQQNQAANLQGDMFNSQQNVGVQDSNRVFGQNAQQQYYGNLQNLGLLGMQQNEANRAYGLNQLGTYGNVTNNSLGASGFGQPNAAMGYGTTGTQLGMQQASQPNYSVFDPNAAINLSMSNAANLNNYNSNIYGANQALVGAKDSASASKTSGIVQGIGTVAAAKIMFMCIPEGETIDTPNGPVAVSALHPGDKVTGFSGYPVHIIEKHEYSERPEAIRFHRFTFTNGKTFAVCDMHRVNNKRAMDYEPGDVIHGNVIENIEVFGEINRSYDLMTEDGGYQMAGVSVNSMIEELSDFARSLEETVA